MGVYYICILNYYLFAENYVFTMEIHSYIKNFIIFSGMVCILKVQCVLHLAGLVHLRDYAQNKIYFHLNFL